MVILLIVSLYKSWFGTAFTFLAAITILLLGGTLSPEEALHGFANEQLGVIILLLIISHILKKSSAINSIFRRILKNGDKPKTFLAKMMTVVGISSAFFNNTPLVAMMMPYVFEWCKNNNQSPSKFLIPLSYASILGGCVTLIGTSTTLIVNALAIKNGATPLSMFDLTPIGLPLLIIGALFLIFWGYKILPDNKIDISFKDKQEQVRQYFMETVVHPSSPIIGKTIQDAELRNLKNFFLVEILRKDKAIRPVGSQEIIEANDKLFFAGDLQSIVKLDIESLGLSLPKTCETSTGRRHDMTEIVISHNSSLIGHDLKELNFRSKFDGAILAIHRNGERIWGHVSRVKLRAGDVLLLIAGKNFNKKIRDNNDFYQISNLKFEEEPDIKKITLIFGGMVLAILLAALKILPLFNSLIILLIISLITKLLNAKDIKESIDYNLIVIIGFGLALGEAMKNSGASELISTVVSALAENANTTILFIGIYIITNILSSVITSKAAIAILIPILLQVAISIGIPSTPMVLLIAFSAAGNFITPFGYQTNLMVYGPGRYKFKDFIKIGTPLTIIYMLICVFSLIYYYNL